MTQLVQDVVLPYGGAERVFWTLERSRAFDCTLVGLVGGQAVRRSARRRVLVHADAAVSDPRGALRALVAAAWRQPRMHGPTLVCHHHAGLQFACTPGKATLYLHTPTRFLWEPDLATWEQGTFAPGELHELRERERTAVAGARALLTNSAYTADRIARAYGRAATVVHPPATLWRCAAAPLDGASAVEPPYVMTTARLVDAKGIERLIDATSSASVRLAIVGAGRAADRIGERAGPHVRLLGNRTDAQLRWLLEHCEAFVSYVPEDFGIAIAEALCEGAPCVVPASGGATEVLGDGHGTTFASGDPDDFARALDRALGIGRASAPSVAAQRERFASERFVSAVLRAMR